MKKIRLLLVDDDEDLRISIGHVLTRRGFEVTPASDGLQALDLIEQNNYDIAVLDLKMPQLGGIDTLAEIRIRHYTLPVLILTGHGVLDDTLNGIALGIVDFINKPVDPESLASRITGLLSEQNMLIEREIPDVMTPVNRFPRMFADEPLRNAIEIFVTSLVPVSEIGLEGSPIILIFDRSERFWGLAGMRDLIRILPSDALINSPYASYLTGMFLGQCMLIENRRAAELLDNENSYEGVDIHAPLMEAVYRLVSTGCSALPILKKGQLAGVLTERGVIQEIGHIVLKDHSV